MKSFLLFCGNFLKYILFLTGFVFVSLFSASSEYKAAEDKIHICFFEIGNTRASDNLRGKTTPQTVVHSYQIGQRETGRKAFERMVKAGHRCDSLVLSGHHTGDWFGKTGTLWLKDMEALSCKPEYRNWFQNIKALWLDGCNTVTDNFIQPGATVKTPDSEAVRVVGKEYENKAVLNSNIMGAYQQSYAGSLDENTPLSSRYLRMFPKTQIYGFNGAAPEADPDPEKDQVGNISFIYNHLTDLGKALSVEAQWQGMENDFERGLKALFSDDPCDEEKMEAWENVTNQAELEAIENQDYKEAHKLGCDLILAKQVLDNPESSDAQRALAKHVVENNKGIEGSRRALNLANRILQKNPYFKPEVELAKELAIELAKLSILKTLQTINKADQNVSEGNKKYSHLLFNNIYDTWNTAKKYKTKDSGWFNNVKSEFRKDSFTSSLKERIKSPYTASLRKGDYIKFYTEIHDVDIRRNDEQAEFVKRHIETLIDKAENVFEDLISPRQRYLNLDTKRALAVSVVDQLLQYNLLNEDQINRLVNNKELFPKNTENPFVADTYTRLKFTDENMIISTVQTEGNSFLKRSAIRIGAGIYMAQADKNQLKELAKEIDTNKLSKTDDSYAFFQAFFRHLQGKTDQEKENFIYDLSANTGEANLEILVLLYADANLSDASKRRLYDRMTDETHPRKFILEN